MITRLVLVAVWVGLVMGCSGSGQNDAQPPPKRARSRSHAPIPVTPATLVQADLSDAAISVDQLRAMQIIGELGIPLGTVREIVATVVSGSTLRMKQYSSSYLLRVESVGGRLLSEPPTMRFFSGRSNAALAEDNFALFKLRHGAAAKSLNSEQIRQLEEGYVGERFTLVAYETGGFEGIPSEMPDDIALWQDTSFFFSTHLMIVAQR